MRQLRAKGTNFRSFVTALRRTRGDEALARTLDLLPAELGDGLRLGVLVTGGWYPVEWYAQLHVAAQKACREGPELSRHIAREAVHDDFRSGAYRLITITLSPESLHKWAPRVMGLYWDGGRLVIEQAEPGRAMGRFQGFAGFDRNLWEDIIGGTMGVLELAGARGIAPRVLAGGGDGDDYMTYLVRWST